MKLTLAGMGDGRRESLTIGLMERLQGAQRIILQTDKVDTAAFLKEKGIVFESLDRLYEEAADFDRLNEAVSDYVLQGQTDTVFCVLGAPYSNTAAVKTVASASKKNVEITVLPGVGLFDAPLCAAMKVFHSADTPVSIVSASDIGDFVPDTGSVACVTEIDTPYKAAQVKERLANAYGDEKDITLYMKNAASTKKLYELDRLSCYGYDTALTVHPDALTDKQRYTFADLVRIMGILRGRDGCPWDREQTHESLKQYLLEETYEVLEAVDEGDPDKLADELGDVLLQVVFHAVIAGQTGEFNIDDVTTAICRKLISRHTHIFGSAKAHTPRDVMVNWEAVKKKEKGHETYTEVLKDVPKSLPALMRGYKVQKKAANIGFDWDTPQGAIDKIKEEALELEAELHKGSDPGVIGLEAGDLLFSMVNLLRMIHVEPELALNRATEKFISRFEQMEKLAKSRGSGLKGMTLQEMDALWNEVKKIRK